ncbi:macrophage infectivity potentiator Mip [Sessilibacter corallicola]|uniref:Peptidyl-prolyl cis-trans isomerase n=2 Tax=Sessilibacter corallicola TaxID=2904075 RepID=A0ABQ0A6B3_9GAMM
MNQTQLSQLKVKVKNMKLKLLASVVASSALLMACAGDKPVKEEEKAPFALETFEQKVSYVVGLNIGRQFESDEIQLDMAALVQALEDSQSESDPKMTDDEMRVTMEELREKMTARLQAQQAEAAEAARVAAEANAKEGEEFLAANSEKEGITTTESGLQYKVVTEGTGAKPGPTDKVTVHYRGTLIDGSEFDSSYGRGSPATFGVNQVISGWTEALQLMSEGSKWELYIPSDLAYGPGGTGGLIGPNATLIFEVELLNIGDAPEEESSEG